MIENQLIPYFSIQLTASKVLVLAPHPDDETFGCGGSLLQHTGRGEQVKVVFLTNGAKGSSQEREKNYYIALRRKEAKSACAVLGVTNMEFWRFEDRSLYDSPTALSKIVYLLNRFQPKLVYVPSPMEIHPDHRATAFFVEKAIKKNDFDFKIAFYEISQPILGINSLVDITPVLDRKKEAMAAYESQIQERPYDEICVSLNRFRSLTLPPSVTHVEGFFICDAKTIKKGYFLKNLFQKFPEFYHFSNMNNIHFDTFAQRNDADLLQLDNNAQQDFPVVSVIVPTYNRPGMLRRALHSIVNQTFQDFEVIVVNDCGEDVSYIVKSFEQNGRQFIYEYHAENRGVAAARNTGIRKARGRFIAYLDDDDFYFPTHLEKVTAALSKGEYKVVYTGACERIEKQCRLAGERISYNSPFDRQKLIAINYIPTPCVAHESSVLHEVGLFDEELKSHEDWDMWIRLSQKYDFYHIDRLTVSWTHHIDKNFDTLSQHNHFLHTFHLIQSRYGFLNSCFNSLDFQKQVKSHFDLTYYDEKISNEDCLRNAFLKQHVYSILKSQSQGKTFLDLFCKNGAGSHLLSKTAVKVTGLDWPRNIKKAQNIFFKDNLDFLTIENEKSEIPIQGEEAFDYIIWLNCDIDFLKKYICDIQRLLKKDGIFLLSTSPISLSSVPTLSLLQNLKTLLSESFANSVFWGQQVYPSSNIFPLSTNYEKINEFLVEKSENSFLYVNERNNISSFIGAFSNFDISPDLFETSYLADVSCSLFQDRQKVITDLQEDLRNKDGMVLQLVQQKNQHIDNLESIIESRDQFIKDIVWNKDQHIQNIETAIQSKNEYIDHVLQEKDQHIQNLEMRILIVSDLEKIIEDKDNHIHNIGKIIEDKDNHIHNIERKLDTLLSEKDKHLFFLAEEKKRSNQFEKELSVQNHLIQSQKQQIYDKEIHIRNRENELDLIKNSIVWRSAEFFRNLVYNKILGVFPVLRNGVLTFRLEGRKAFFKKTKIYLQKKRIFPISNEEKNEYEKWIDKNRLTRKNIVGMSGNIEDFHYKPKISLIMPVYNVDQKWLKKAIQSVLNQIYTNWELCIADDASTRKQVRKVLEKYSNKDKRIKIQFLPKNQGISGASNAALSLATGEFIGLLDNDDELSKDALFKCVRLLNEHPDADLIYSDEDKLEMDGRRTEPYFKPDFSLDLLLSMNYICHFCVIRTSIVRDIKGFRVGYDGSQDHDLVLRVIEKTAHERIFHIPEILYHWRKIPGSAAMVVDAKNYAFLAAKKAIKDYLNRNDIEGEVFDGLFMGSYRVRRKILNCAKVSIIIPFKDHAGLLKRCIHSIWDKTSYPNYEVVLVNNRSKEKETIEYLNELKSYKNVKLLEYNKPFNFSAINNFAVNQIDGEYVMLLNNDIEVISKEWLSSMVEHIQREEVGCVGAKLLFPNNTIQHAGIIMGIGVASHAFSGLPADSNGYAGFINTIRNYCAVTGACLLTCKKTYEDLGGLDEERFSVAYNDVDFCLKTLRSGLRVVYTPYAVLYHHESASRGNDNDPNISINDPDQFYRIMAEREYMMEKWEDYIQKDPYYNPNLTRGRNDFSIRLD